uniref:LigA n=1 Tax=Parastrongyloides trichosuri TaxID=131310 RepID=A0A0N4ZJF1_PARTI
MGDDRILRTALTDKRGEGAGVDASQGDDAARLHPGVQPARGAPVGRISRHVAQDDAARRTLGRLADLLDVFQVHADIADMRECESYDLTCIGRICQNFLIAGEGGVEDHLANGRAGRADADPRQDRSICEHEDAGGAGQDLSRHGAGLLAPGQAGHGEEADAGPDVAARRRRDRKGREHRPADSQQAPARLGRQLPQRHRAQGVQAQRQHRGHADQHAELLAQGRLGAGDHHGAHDDAVDQGVGQGRLALLRPAEPARQPARLGRGARRLAAHHGPARDGAGRLDDGAGRHQPGHRGPHHPRHQIGVGAGRMGQDVGRNDAEHRHAGRHIDDEGQQHPAQRGAPHVGRRVLDLAGQGRRALDAQEGPEDHGQRGRNRLHQRFARRAPGGDEGVAAEGDDAGDDGQTDRNQPQHQGDRPEPRRRLRPRRIGRGRQPDQRQIAERAPHRLLQRRKEEGQIAGPRHRHGDIAGQAGRPIGQPRLIAQKPPQTAPGEVRQAIGLRLHPPQTAEHQRQGHGSDAADDPADDAAAAGRRQGGGQQVDARSDHIPRHHKGGQAPADAVRGFRQDVDLAHARRIDRNVAAPEAVRRTAGRPRRRAGDDGPPGPGRAAQPAALWLRREGLHPVDAGDGDGAVRRLGPAPHRARNPGRRARDAGPPGRDPTRRRRNPSRTGRELPPGARDQGRPDGPGAQAGGLGPGRAVRRRRDRVGEGPLDL